MQSQYEDLFFCGFTQNFEKFVLMDYLKLIFSNLLLISKLISTHLIHIVVWDPPSLRGTIIAKLYPNYG